MRLPPRDNRRPATLLTALAAVSLTVAALFVTAWVRAEAADRGYVVELRRTLRKYRGAAAVPRASARWLGRVHGRDPARVREDLAAAAAEPGALDPDTPLTVNPGPAVRAYLRYGFLRFWLLASLAALVAALPVIALVVRRAQPKRRRPGADDWGV